MLSRYVYLVPLFLKKQAYSYTPKGLAQFKPERDVFSFNNQRCQTSIKMAMLFAARLLLNW